MSRRIAVSKSDFARAGSDLVTNSKVVLDGKDEMVDEEY
jgi:hypothetical protein